MQLFFQAEDGIRDVAVTGVQTCALPISSVVDPVGLGAEPISLHPAARPRDCERRRPRGHTAAGVGRPGIGRGRVAAVGVLPAAGIQEFGQRHLAYLSAPEKCSDTYGSVPSTQVSCPGAMWNRSPGPSENALPSSMTTRHRPETTSPTCST